MTGGVRVEIKTIKNFTTPKKIHIYLTRLMVLEGNPRRRERERKEKNKCINQSWYSAEMIVNRSIEYPWCFFRDCLSPKYSQLPGLLL
jgi:hypothetical protein